MSTRTITISSLMLVALTLLTVGCGSDQSDATDVNSAMSEFEQEVLADQTVTADEYTDARNRTVGCLTEAGFEAEFLAQNDRIFLLSVDSGAPSPGEADEDFEARFMADSDACKAEFLDDIELAWVRETAPSEEEVQAAFRSLQSCLAPLGLEITDDGLDAVETLLNQIDNMVDEGAQLTALECVNNYSLSTSSGG